MTSRESAQTSGFALEDPRKVWLTEPDERLWTDPQTGYTCLATRGPVGAWCGYVRVPDDHPAHGFDYYASSIDFDDLAKWTAERIAVQSQINDIQVHGGLTFASDDRPCGGFPGWWFGFDCAHAGDYSPKMDRLDDPHTGLGKPTGWGGVITYRALPYVEAGCTALAQQLAAIAKASPSSPEQVPGDRSRDDQKAGS